MKPNETCRRAPSANIFADELAAQHIAMSGYAVGSFTLDVSEQQGDILVASTTFVNIPTTASTTVALNILSGITTMSPLMIDIRPLSKALVQAMLILRNEVREAEVVTRSPLSA